MKIALSHVWDQEVELASRMDVRQQSRDRVSLASPLWASGGGWEDDVLVKAKDIHERSQMCSLPP
jgi:hypothetical protein